MAENNNLVVETNNEQDIVQDDTIESYNESGSGNRFLSNKNIMIAVGALVAAIFCYKMFLSGGEKKDVISTDEIVKSNVTSKTNQAVDRFTDVDSLINGKSANNSTTNINELIPTVPEVDISKIEVPDLSDDLKSNIEKEIESEINTTSEYFTKEQVDDLISEKLKAFEEQMASMKEESNKLAKKLEEAETKKEKEDKVKRNLIFAPNRVNNQEKDNETDNPFADDSSSYAEEREEARKKEEEELKRVQRSKSLAQRKTSPMFKMQGGGGGESAMDQESIVVMDKNLLIDIKNTEQGVVPTKTQDLTRVILQGKIIEATLETAINTDVVSQVRAVVTRDVYAEYGKNVLIPKGSRIVGTFQSNVTSGVARLGIVWNRIIRVDGLSLNISANAADQLGRGGVEGDLDNKYFQTLRNSFLSSLITIATSIAVDEVSKSGGLDIQYDKDKGITTYSGDATAYAVREATSDFMDDVSDVVDNLKQEKPTIRIAQGTKIVVVVNQDLNLPIYKKK